MRKIILIVVLLAIMSIDVFAASNTFEEKLKTFKGKFFERNHPAHIEPNTEECLPNCLKAKDECTVRCKKVNYAVCTNNCLSQSSKCKQDCKGLEYPKRKTLPLSNILGRFYSVFSKSS